MDEAECVELTLSASNLADSAVLKDLILCFWGHILYIRNQVPLPLSSITGEALKKMINEPHQSRSKINYINKILKFDSRYLSLSLSVDTLLRDLEKQKGKNQLKTVCVIIGPSASSGVREAHFLHFEADMSDTFSNADQMVRLYVDYYLYIDYLQHF